MLNWLRGLVGGNRAGTPVTATPVSRAAGRAADAILARYDNAQTTGENSRNWWAADYLSAKSANSFQVRRILRMRSRYEVSNNPYLFGIANNNADDLIGGGPTLQVQTPDAGYNREVERAWAEWGVEVGYAEKLRTTKLAKTVDGEGFLVLKTVEDLENPVKLYPCDVEADQVTTPSPTNISELWVDGLTLHPVTGRPTAYHVLRHHPGDYYFPDLNPLRVDRINARHVIHWFAKFRPGQVRGVPVFTPSLDLFAELRAFRRAVLGAAELAADFAAVIQQDRATGAYAGEDTDEELEAFKRVPIDRKMMTTLPPGAVMNQFDPKQPTTSYDQFQEKCLGEACRPLSYPLNLALGTSQKFNFSSAKLDHINYRSGLTGERGDCDAVVNAKVFAEWFSEAILSGAVRPYDGTRLPPHEWHWPGFEPLDAVADAQADHQRLAGGSDTWRDFWARRGKDWRDVLAQQADEQKEIAKLGVRFGQPATLTVTEDGDSPDEGGGKTPATRGDVAALRDWVIRAFDEGKVKRDADGKFSETGSVKDSSADLKDRARGLAAKVKGIGGKAVAVAKAVVGKVKELAYRATWAYASGGVFADDVLETVHDHFKVANDREMNRQIAESLGIPFNTAVQSAVVKIGAFAITRFKEAIARRREQKAKSAGRSRLTARKEMADAEKAKAAAEVLGVILRAMGVSRGNLPTPADVAKTIRKGADSAGRSGVRATKDGNGQQHDEKGRFGEGGGGGEADPKKDEKGAGDKGKGDKPHDWKTHPVARKLVGGLRGSPGLSDEQKQHYSKAAGSVLSRMPKAAHDRMDAHIASATFHPDNKAVAAGAMADALAKPGLSDGAKAQIENVRDRAKKGEIEVGGCYVPHAGAVHADGGIANANSTVSTLLPKNSTAHIYAHEWAHAIDGPHYELSGSKAWAEAHAGEMSGGGLTQYAATQPKESFAEFGRLLYAGNVPHDEVEKKFPKASAFFKERGLWPNPPKTTTPPSKSSRSCSVTA